MSLKARLENDLKQAMRDRDLVRKRTLRMALAAMRLSEIDQGASLDENGLLAVLQKEVKSHHESIADARRAARPDLEQSYQAELEILQEYLPRPFSPEELEALVRQIIVETGAVGAQDMGRVMKALTPQLQGRATGNQASQVVRKLLQ